MQHGRNIWALKQVYRAINVVPIRYISSLQVENSDFCDISESSDNTIGFLAHVTRLNVLELSIWDYTAGSTT